MCNSNVLFLCFGLAMMGWTLPLFGQPPKLGVVEYDQGDPPEVVIRSTKRIRNEWKRVSDRLVDATSREDVAKLRIRRGYLLLSVHARERAYQDFRQAARDYINPDANDNEVRKRTVDYIHFLLQGRREFPPTPSHDDGGLNEYYGSGYHAFWRGDVEQALEYFELALDIEPFEPTCHYYRALCYRCKGDDSAAVAAIRNAAFWEYQLLRASYGHQPSHAPSRVNGALERVQGHTRLWVESYRPSKPSGAISTPQDFVRNFGRRSTTSLP